MSNKTLSMEVDQGGLTFLIENQGKDCSDSQMYRELTQNSIEAIIRGDYDSGKVIWDVFPDSENKFGAPKLSIIDTGIGMSHEEIIRYINRLSSSGGSQGFTGNFGIGAKIAAATRNKAGVMYESWKEGASEGVLAVLWKDPQSGRYGLKSLDDSGETFVLSIPISEAPDEIRAAGRGTRVTLFGDNENENTMMPKSRSDMPGGRRWLVHYLESKYFTFPKRVNVVVKEAHGTEHVQERRIKGMKENLDGISSAKGVMPVDGGKIHWWVLDKERMEKKKNSLFPSGGHCALIYQDELYSMLKLRAGATMLQQFGVSVATKRVVIYVEPKNSRILPSTSRSDLKLDGEPFPWDVYAEQFRNNLPHEIQQLIDEEIAKLETSNSNLGKIWKKIKQWFDFPNYRQTQMGTESLMAAGMNFGGSSENSMDYEHHTDQDDYDETGQKSFPAQELGKRPGDSNTRINAFLRAKSKSPIKGIMSNETCLPKINWVSEEDNEGLVDRAASYDQFNHALLINKDFRGFTSLIDQVVRDFDHEPTARTIAINAMRSEYELVLFETVLGLLKLRQTSSGKWTADDFKAATSPEALTAAVMPRYHQMQAIKRSLATNIGREKFREQDRAAKEAVW